MPQARASARWKWLVLSGATAAVSVGLFIFITILLAIWGGTGVPPGPIMGWSAHIVALIGLTVAAYFAYRGLGTRRS